MARRRSQSAARVQRPTAAPAHAEARDRGLLRVRVAAWILGVGAAAGTAVLSVVSAHAFKGHTGGTGATTARAPATQSAPRRAPIQVPGPQSVPAISGAPAPLQPPPAPPDAAASSQPAPAAPPPPVSGGS